MVTVVSYTIYHSPNSYLGVLLADRLLAGLPVRLERRPIFVPRHRGVKVADLIGGSEPARKSAYHREDCARWARHHGIEIRFLDAGVFEERAERWRQMAYSREELPARAFYAARGPRRLRPRRSPRRAHLGRRRQAVLGEGSGGVAGAGDRRLRVLGFEF